MIRATPRLWAIWKVTRRYGLSEFWGGKPGDHAESRGARLRLALQELGPVFIKFGQALSTRPDILPHDVAAELAQLQDKVEPFPGAEARALIERSLGKRIEEMFDAFDEVPLAAASVAQVHTARLKPQDEGDPGLRGGDQGAAAGRARAGRERCRPAAGDGRIRRALASARQASQAARSGGRVRAGDLRRAGSDARRCELLAAAPQLARFGADLPPDRVLGLHPRRCAGDGAHPRRQLARAGPAARDGRELPGARRARRGDLFQAGVPRQFLPRRHASPATSLSMSRT